MNINKIDTIYYYCYATANDSRLYLKDIQNFLRIKKNFSGYNRIALYIAISEVKKVNIFDKYFVRLIIKLFKNHPSITLKEIFFKTNKGRDFSSYYLLLKKVKETSNLNDYIFFQNRSGYGPLKENWYRQFVTQLEKSAKVAICGSTINFNDIIETSNKYKPHVQTYAFISKIEYLNLLGDSFPGSMETDKTQIIIKGEIALSQFYLEKGYTINCIEWPNDEITNTSMPIVEGDIKDHPLGDHSFYHRKYFKDNFIIKSLKGISAWMNLYYQILFNKS